MLLRFGRRALSLATGFFALLGFIAVPLGDKTGYEHVCAALRTPEGARAVTALSDAYDATKARLFGYVKGKLTEPGSPTDKALSELGNGDAVNGQGSTVGGIRRVVGHDEGRVGALPRGGRKDATVSRREER